MKALLAAAAASVSLLAGVGASVDVQATTPAAETLVARNEVHASVAEPGRIQCDKTVFEQFIYVKCEKDKKDGKI